MWRSKGYEFFPIMAAIRYDVDPLFNRISELLKQAAARQAV